METSHLTATVLICRGVGHLYDYEIPHDLADMLTIGTHIEVGFGPGIAMGLVITIQPRHQVPYKLRPIRKILTKKPVINPQSINLIFWLSDTYITTPHKAYQTIVGNRTWRPISEPPTIPDWHTPHPLTPDQENAIQTILDSDKPKFALVGVTGSGKTEVYIQLAKAMRDINKSTLMLLPEIALTPQLRDRFRERFGTTAVVVHSGLTPKQRDIAYTKIAQGTATIVIGPRSVIFSPIVNCGLIIIDEAHDDAYKQDQHPRYWTHRIADYCAGQWNAKLVLGSATPDIETIADIQSNRIVNVAMPRRIHNRPLPTIEIVDFRRDIQSGTSGPFSQALKNEIEKTLLLRQKIMILINRRGYAPLVICSQCGHVHCCPDCQLSYVMHRDRHFRCHRCQITVPMTLWCSNCKTQRLTFSGLGIQKVEVELIRSFPTAKILRLDRDTAPSATVGESILAEFKDRGDILVGTQLIAKGHDIPDVTLVGILGIDAILNIPDFRSQERAFNLITQVSGRAGRGDQPGQVVIQTCMPNHVAIHCAATYNRELFIETELKNRERYFYPPYSALIHIIVTAPDSATAASDANDLVAAIRTQLPAITILGPKPAPVEVIKSIYRWSVLLKSDPTAVPAIRTCLTEILKPNAISSKVIVDFDPRSLV